MATYAAADVASQIAPLLQKIQETNRPDKVDAKWIARVGFAKSTDRSLIRVLKQIGFISNSGIPTERWQGYRSKQAAPGILAEGIREGYPELYDTYSDAHQRPADDLKSFFAEKTEGTDETRRRILRTFQTLCSLAKFSETQDIPQKEQPSEETSPQPETTAAVAQTKTLPTVHIDLQIHISAEAGPEQIDEIFASMARHLYGK